MATGARFAVWLVDEGGRRQGCTVADGELLSAALERAGIIVPQACRGGACGACLGWVEEGSVAYPHGVSRSRLDTLAADGGQPALLCRATACSDLLIRMPRGWSAPCALPLSLALRHAQGTRPGG